MTHSDNEFIKIYRKFMEWEWYTDINTKVLFIHCLIRANWKPGQWHGIPYEAGEFITSLESLSTESGLSVQQVRTAIKHLTSTGEITSSTTNKATGKKLSKCRIITVNHWNVYQCINKHHNMENNDQLTNDQQASNKQTTNRQQASNKLSTDCQQANNRQATTDKEYKECKENQDNSKEPNSIAALPHPGRAAETETDKDDGWIDTAAMTEQEFDKYMEEIRNV